MTKTESRSGIPTGLAVLIVIVALGVGYLLVRTAPSQSSQPATSTSDPMHASAGAPLSTQLSDLVGKPLPAFTLATKDGGTIDSSSFKGKETVLFFSEGLMCYPACWNQMAAFGKDSRFNSNGVQTFAIVADPASDWQQAVAKMPDLAKVSTLFDQGAQTARQLGMVMTASSMHRGSLAGHTYLIVDKDGVVRFVFDDPNMAIQNDMLYGKIQELSK